jgi:hypothetical protein
MRWVDVKPSTGAANLHSVFRHRGQLSHLCCDRHDSFAAGNRPTLNEVACLHVAGRAKTVQVRLRDGAVVTLERGPAESVAAGERTETVSWAPSGACTARPRRPRARRRLGARRAASGSDPATVDQTARRRRPGFAAAAVARARQPSSAERVGCQNPAHGAESWGICRWNRVLAPDPDDVEKLRG